MSAPQSEPPFTTVITYNQSKHATNSVLADIRAVWGPNVRVIQTLEDGLQRLPGMDGALYVQKGMCAGNATLWRHLCVRWSLGCPRPCTGASRV